MADRRSIITPSSKIAKRKKRRRIIFTILAILIPILFLTGIVYFAHAKSFTISSVEIKGSIISHQDISKGIAEQDISGNYLFVFPKANTLIYPKKKLEADILASNKIFQSVRISVGDNQKLLIEVSERKPFALWCVKQTDASATAHTEKCYFLDKTGYIFAAAPQFSGDVFFRFYGGRDADDSSDPIGTQYIETARLESFGPLMDQLKQVHIMSLSITVVDQEQFKIETDSGMELIFSDAPSYDQVISNLVTLINQNHLGTAQVPFSAIQYVDLRFGNKIYYKLSTSTSTKAQ